MRLGVFGGAALQDEADFDAATSFGELLGRVRRRPGRADLVARLQISGDDGPRVFASAEKSTGDVVRGRRTLRVTVAR